MIGRIFFNIIPWFWRSRILNYVKLLFFRIIMVKQWMIHWNLSSTLINWGNTKFFCNIFLDIAIEMFLIFVIPFRYPLSTSPVTYQRLKIAFSKPCPQNITIESWNVEFTIDNSQLHDLYLWHFISHLARNNWRKIKKTIKTLPFPTYVN